jgi:hypothetical protein
MRVRFLRLHFWLALCCLIAPAAGVAFATNGGNDLPGIYQGHAPAADAARREFTLSLKADGTAVLTTLFIGKGKVSERGRWSLTGRQITLAFDPIGPNGPPRPITFRYRSRKLSPVTWDTGEWGSHGPPVLYRSSAQAGY